MAAPGAFPWGSCGQFRPMTKEPLPVTSPLHFDILTATPRDVIRRSMAMHPTLFAEAMEAAARTHGQYAASPIADRRAARIAAGCHDDCTQVADWIRDDDLAAIMAELRFWIPALNVAFRLQCIPASYHGAIACRAESR